MPHHSFSFSAAIMRVKRARYSEGSMASILSNFNVAYGHEAERTTPKYAFGHAPMRASYSRGSIDKRTGKMSDEQKSSPEPEPEPETAKKLGFVGRFRHPDETQMRRFAAQTPFLWVYVVVLTIATFQIYADPLGFDGLNERYSQQLVNLTLTGPLYPNTGRDQVSVALLEDDTLAELDLIWPWPYSEHARALDAILAYEPRAVAVDILFADAREDPSLEQLLFVIERYARFGVPLYFVGSPNVTPPVRAELSESSASIVAGTIDITEGVARQYPESVSCLNGNDENCPSLALRIYEDLYENDVPLSGHEETALVARHAKDLSCPNRLFRLSNFHFATTGC
jgi:hypothetical protein